MIIALIILGIMIISIITFAVVYLLRMKKRLEMFMSGMAGYYIVKRGE